MRTVLRSIGHGLVVLVLTLGSAHAQEAKIIKYGAFIPASAQYFQGVLIPWFNKINKDGKGVLEIKTFFGGALGRNPVAQIKLVSSGVADMVFLSLSYTPGDFPDQSVLELPFMFKSAREGSIVHRRLYDKGMLAGYERYHFINAFTLAPYTLHAVKPIKSVSDLKGKKIRVAGATQAAIIKALGGTPVNVRITGVAEALDRGVVDATLSDWNGIFDFKITEVAFHHLELPFTTIGLADVMNKDVYAGLSPKAKALLNRGSGEELASRSGENFDKRAASIKKRYKSDSRHKFYLPSGAKRDEIARKLQPITDKWLADRPGRDKILAEARKILAELRK